MHARQDRAEWVDLAERLAAIESKLETRQGSNISNPLIIQHYQDQRQHMHKASFKIEIRRFDGANV